MKTSLLLVMTSMLALPAFGQSDADQIKTAINVIKGKENVMEKVQALSILEASQVTEKDGYVLNVLGVAYLHGIGTEADTAKAISKFEEAGNAGYSPAYHNLGMYYKYAQRDKQDFAKAFDSFMKGVGNNSVSNYYNCGFMKYKGLGCEQNYEEAIEYFTHAADFNHPDAIYMLGLCYRNGYGVDADTTIANAYLRQAASLGCTGAMEELLNETPENNKELLLAELATELDVPESMPSIIPFVPNQKQDVSGSYKGYLATYDWSGSNILSETPLYVDLAIKGDNASGLWIQGNDSIKFSALLSNDGTLSFDSTEVNLYDRYAWNYSARYRFEKMDMSCIDGLIVGQLRLYSLDEQEPERPMYVCLEKNPETDPTSSDTDSKLYAYSVPSSGHVILKFNLAQAVNDVKISFYNKNGFNCLNYKYGSLDEGEHELTLSADLEKGFYTINVSAGTQHFQTKIAK